MALPVTLKLGKSSQPFWLTRLAKPQESAVKPLQLFTFSTFSGQCSQGVEVEDSLILAASPLLQQLTIKENFSSSTAIFLPFATSQTLRNMVVLLRQGRVTLTKEELFSLKELLSVLQVNVATSFGAVPEGDPSKTPTTLEDSIHSRAFSPSSKRTSWVDRMNKQLEERVEKRKRKACDVSATDAVKRKASKSPQFSSESSSAPLRQIEPSALAAAKSTQPIKPFVPDIPKSLIEVNHQQGTPSKMIKSSICTAPALNQVTTKELVPEGFVKSFVPGVRQSEVSVRRGSVLRHLINTGTPSSQAKASADKNWKSFEAKAACTTSDHSYSLTAAKSSTGTNNTSPRTLFEIRCPIPPHLSPTARSGNAIPLNHEASYSVRDGPVVILRNCTEAAPKKKKILGRWDTKETMATGPEDMAQAKDLTGGTARPNINMGLLRKNEEMPLVKKPSEDPCNPDRHFPNMDANFGAGETVELKAAASKEVQHSVEEKDDPDDSKLTDKEEVEQLEKLVDLLEPERDLGEDSDSTPSLVDASDSVKNMIGKKVKELNASLPPKPSQLAEVTPAPGEPTSEVVPPRQTETLASSKHSKSIVIMDSEGEWTVGGGKTPLFKPKTGSPRNLKKPFQFKQIKTSSPADLPAKKKRDQPAHACQQPSSSLDDKISTPVLSKCSEISNNAEIVRASPKLSKTSSQIATNEATSSIQASTPPKCGPPLAQTAPNSDPVSLKRMALGLRQSRFVGRRTTFASLQDSIVATAKWRTPETPQVIIGEILLVKRLQDCPKCGRSFRTGAGLAHHLRKHKRDEER